MAVTTEPICHAFLKQNPRISWLDDIMKSSSLKGRTSTLGSDDYRGVFRWGACPQSSIEWIFYGKNRLCWDCSLYQKCSVDLKYAKNALAAGDPPEPRWGSLRRSPGALSRLGRGASPSQSQPLSAALAPRFSRLRRSASVPPNVKSWLRPWITRPIRCDMTANDWHRTKTGRA